MAENPYAPPSEITLAIARANLAIDKYNLDVILEQQSVWFDRVQKKYVEALDERDWAEKEMKEIEAEVSKEVREEMMRFEAKPSDKRVEQQVYLNPRYKRAVKDYLDWKNQTEKWKGMLSSYNQRNFALHELGSLYESGYFQINSIGGKRSERVRSERTEYEHNKDLLAQNRKPLERAKLNQEDLENG